MDKWMRDANWEKRFIDVWVLGELYLLFGGYCSVFYKNVLSEIPVVRDYGVKLNKHVDMSSCYTIDRHSGYVIDICNMKTKGTETS